MKEQKLYESIAKNLEQKIRQGIYRPGTRLPGERELAKQFKVSRVTIRQALIALQALGSIQVRAGSGAHVLASNTSKMVLSSDVSALEVTEARLLIESEVAALAAEHMNPGTEQRLEDLVREMSRKDHGSSEISDLADRDFHLTIALAAGNSVLYELVCQLWQIRLEVPAVRKVYDAVCVEDATLRGAEHQEILDTLKCRDPLGAKRTMRQHFTRLLAAMLDVTEQEALEDVRRRADESRARFLKNTSTAIS